MASSDWAPTTAEHLAGIRYLAADAVRYVRGILGHDPWEVPERILRAIDKPRARVAVKSCHASGKTHTAGEGVICHVSRHDDGIAVTTAPTWTQVKEVLWREIRSQIDGARVAFPKPSTVRWDMGPKQYAMGLSTNEGTRFQGWHGRILIVVDEAAGVRPAIIEAAEGIRAGGDVRFLWLGNPTITSGPFYEVFSSTRGVGWTLITISAFDTPNFAGLGRAKSDGSPPDALLTMTEDDLNTNVRPYLITRSWVREMWEVCQHNPEHPFWQARVLGEFPTQDVHALIPLGWIERAKRNWYDLPRDPDGTVIDDGGSRIVGIDVAGPGDAETVRVTRSGGPLWKVEIPEAWRSPDPRGEVMRSLLDDRARIRGGAYDAIGIGYYFGLPFAEAGIPLDGVNVSDKATDSERFGNLKAQLYWGLREQFQEDGVALDDDAVLCAQLAGLRYFVDARGKIWIESKEDARKRGVQSPDRAEALMLTVGYVPGLQTTSDEDLPAEIEESDGDAGDEREAMYRDLHRFEE